MHRDQNLVFAGVRFRLRHGALSARKESLRKIRVNLHTRPAHHHYYAGPEHIYALSASSQSKQAPFGDKTPSR